MNRSTKLIKRKEGGTELNFHNLIGIYQFAIARCIDVIGFDNDITRNDDGTHTEVVDIISAVDTLTIDNGNIEVIYVMRKRKQ